MIRYFFFLSLLANVWILSSVSAQGSYHYNGGTTVIAPSGINMRQSPGLNATKNGAIPFGEKVEIVDTLITVFDTVDNIHTIRNGKEIKRPIVGGWLKVKYRNKIGYVFSGLIGNYRENALREDLIIRDVGFACEELLIDSRKYHWYGLFPGNNHTELRKIKPTIYDFSEELPATIYTSGEKEPCLIIIASLKPLPSESLIRPGGLPVSLKSKDLPAKTLHMPTFSMQWKTDQYEGGKDFSSLHLHTQGKEYPLFWAYDSHDEETLPFGGHPLSATDLIWYGDLNNDGYLDIIVRSEYEYGTILLFMGSQDKMTNVATFIHGPCC